MLDVDECVKGGRASRCRLRCLAANAPRSRLDLRLGADMFDNLCADLRRYAEHCYPGRASWSVLLRLPYTHPACVGVAWYRYGAWALRLRIPVLKHATMLIYALLMPLARLYSGAQIDPRTPIGPGLAVLHFGGVVLTRDCQIGRNCVLHHNVSIVTTNNARAATIGDNFYAGCGAIIVGNVIIENNVVVGAGSVVTRSLPANAIVGGVPARILRYRTEKERPPRIVVGNQAPEAYLERPALPGVSEGGAPAVDTVE